MGFIDRQSRPQRPNTKYFKWKGGVEKIKNAKGEIEVVGGKLVYWDNVAKVEEEASLPMTFCPLEQTSSVGGYVPGRGRITSNEIVSQNQNFRVYLGNEVIGEGKWNDIKDAVKGQGGSFTSNVYAYVPELDEIVMISFSGSSLGAFFEYSKKNDIYSSAVIFSEQVQYRKTGKIEFAVPTLVKGNPYSKDEIDALTEKDNQVKDFLKSLNKPKQDGQILDDVDVDDVIDQTPDQYDGEQSQDVAVTIEEAMGDGTEEVDLSEIPF